MQHLTLENAAGGAAVEKFEDALAEVLENIQDPNTDAKAPRKITMTFTFKPQADRQTVPMKVDAVPSLAPRVGANSIVYVGPEKGELVALTQDLRQREMFDPQTGEVIDQEAEDEKVVPMTTERNGTE